MWMNKTYVEADWDGNDGVIGPIALNWRGGVTGLQIHVEGTINYNLEVSNSDLQMGDDAEWAISDSEAHDGATASQLVRFEATPRFMRIVVNSSTTATVTLNLVQSDV